MLMEFNGPGALHLLFSTIQTAYQPNLVSGSSWFVKLSVSENKQSAQLEIIGLTFGNALQPTPLYCRNANRIRTDMTAYCRRSQPCTKAHR